jgi:zinc transport system ATP-binding protein
VTDISPTANNLLMRAQQLSVTRHGRKILQQINLELFAGKIVTLIGPNGAGKTTLVRTLLGLIKPDQGHIHRATDLRIGYMPQKLVIEPSLPLTVARFLMLSNHRSSRSVSTLEGAIKDIAGLTGISQLMNTPMQSLSGGETQRVLLARALLRKPNLLVLDEPVQGVDITGQAALYGLINQIRQEHQCGVLLVSHDLHLVMANTDTVICLNQHICCQGHPEQVTHDPAYLALFSQALGAQALGAQPTQVALYTHHHDHQHNNHGDVIKENSTDHSHCEHNHHA